MKVDEINFTDNGALFVAPTGVRILSRCIASSEYSCTFGYFSAMNVPEDTLKKVISNMTESETEYESSDKQIVMQTTTESDAFKDLIDASNIVAVGEIDMTNHVITSKADFTEVYIHMPNRFGTKTFFMNSSSELILDITNDVYKDGSDIPTSFKDYCKNGKDFEFNAIALYLNISDGDSTYTSLYGIYVPNKGAASISKYAYATDAGSIVSSGNSYGFRINLRIVADSELSGTAGSILTDIDENTNSFSMSLFTDALARMQMILANQKDLSEEYGSLYDDVRNLQAICDTGTTISQLSDKVAKLSEYIDNYMLAIEDKDSLLNMIANINRQVQSLVNGETSTTLNIEVPIQAGDGIRIEDTDSDHIIHNTNQRYHIDGTPFDTSSKSYAISFIPVSFSNIFPVYRRSNNLSSTLKLSIDTNSSSASQYMFKQGQSFQFVIMDDIDWGGYGCDLYIDSHLIGSFTTNDIQCSKPIFEIICTSAPTENDKGGTYSSCTFWARCINPKYESGTSDDNNLIPVTYEEAVALCKAGSLKLDKVYYLTDYAFAPSSSNYSSLHDDIKISIFMRPSDKTHFDPNVFMNINSSSDGSQNYAWGKYYLQKSDVPTASILKKGYITELSYGSIKADFDFIHCAIKSTLADTTFRTNDGDFAQNLKGGEYDTWITSATGIDCSINATDAIESSYVSSDYYPAIDINNCDKISINIHNDAAFKLPIMHIAKCNEIKVTCYGESIFILNSEYITLNDSSDVMIRDSNSINVDNSDNVRIHTADESYVKDAYNVWLYNSSESAIQNISAVLLDSNSGSNIGNISGNCVIILNYSNSNRKQKAIIDNVSSGCLIADNLSIATEYTGDAFICNKYDAVYTKGQQFYMVKKIMYLDDDETKGVSEELHRVHITGDNINSLI